MKSLKKFEKESSDSSIDDDGYLDEQEDPMTDQQSPDNNQNPSVPTSGGNNTLPIKSTGNTTRSVIFHSSHHFLYFFC